MDWTLLQNRLVVALIAGVLGAFLTILTQRLLNKRGLFTYFVWHNRVGVSIDDAILGSVRSPGTTILSPTFTPQQLNSGTRA